MRRLATAPVVLIGIALMATAVAALNPPADASFAPIPPEVFERAEANRPRELHSFEARETFAGRSAESELETAPRPSSSSPRERTAVSDHDEADNDLPFEEAQGSKQTPGGETEGRRVLRVSSNCGNHTRALNSVELALEWLKMNQRADGSWDGDAQTTGLVLLAFLGAGETHKHGRYKKIVRNGLKWLKVQQGADGCFTSRDNPGGQAIATLAMCEAYRLTASPLFKQPSRLALDTLRTLGPAQDPATWWMLFAQHSAKKGGLKEAIPGFERALDLALADAGSTVPGASEQAALGAEILVRIFSGEDSRRSAEIEFLVGECLQTPPSFDDHSADPGALFVKTAAIYQCGGDAWKKWNGKLKDALLSSQTRTGDGLGCWESPSSRGRILGRTQTTALMLLTLEVYYRYSSAFGTR